MSTELETRNAARERLFDALLTDAVEAEAARTAHGGSASRWWLLAAGLLLGLMITVGVALLRPVPEPPVAQDPHAFDPIFPPIERDRWKSFAFAPGVPVEDIAPRKNGYPLAISVSDPGDEWSHDKLIETIVEVACRPGVATLSISDPKGRLPLDVWRRLGDMPDLEELWLREGPDSSGLMEAEGLRELRHAPRLRSITFCGSFRGSVTAADAEALLELPHLTCIQLQLVRSVPDEFLATLRGSPTLQELHLEQCGLGPGWAHEVGRLSTLRWLLLAGRNPINRPNDKLTRADLQELAAIPRLESLTISTSHYDLAPDWIEGLPRSIKVLRLGGEALSASDFERLFTRLDLRGFHPGVLTAAAKRRLADHLPALELERFGCGSLTPELWRALEQTANLRYLSVDVRDLTDDLARCAKLTSLEYLDLEVGSEIDPTAFEVLRALPKLRHVMLTTWNAPTPRFDDPEALRQILGPDVEVVIR